MTKQPYKLSAIDIAALRHGDMISIAFNDDKSNTWRETGVRVIQNARKTEKNPFAVDVEHAIAAPVVIAGSYGLHTIDTAGIIAHSLVYLFHHQHSSASSIVNSLRTGDEILFQFYPDMHTNGYVAAAGLHADGLILIVFRGEGKNRKRLEYEIDNNIAPNNTARMIRGVADSAAYRRDGARVRRENWTPPMTIVEIDETAA